MSTILDIKVRRKSFGDETILQGVELALAEREVVALLGPSGCGKSTLLRIAAGLDKDFQGSVTRAGELSGQHNVTGGGVAFVFQEPRLMPWLTVAQNVGFADGDRADRAWISQLLEEVGLAGWEDSLPKQLSGGMAQRVAIARGLYSRPRVLLLDEPFSAVDAFTRMKLQDLLLSLAQQHQISLLLVTHDIDESLYLGDRVLVMGSRPGNIRNTILVDLPQPRQRADQRLSVFKAHALAELHEAHAF
ncbi:MULTISPECIES: ABC transporter ATP-binding protein [unclassified Herbaspirillum]|uniref:ABC transporter ATP-binding protein n=1 Tax=unclassified Herbaspirillum TaxID=2624150 RepID=UPI000E2EEC52|nr:MULTISPECIES: ABC transporter ATP-binding protein [unclassified Herbaspirillum]RFB73177.1 ABC transporter ATP-binding protein [Herbaspirillum sp. 3R-3a1]TFI11013.1 ABC transporter ATP-binding protein [Herbaspirillum sp. 3R11]TFI16920.1 ABC transporter ATP-binding protein [Herbaspirillum sp. 3R-11]TFI23407.1 ABC transporter ATP-binding protein [Herbaspirillum sp. 3C11]